MSKEPRIKRVTVSLPTELLQVLDELGRNLGHKSRSETVRAAARDFIAEHRWGGGLASWSYDATIQPP